MGDLAKEIAEKAVERQMEIMQEQQKKAQEFVDSKVNEFSLPQSFFLGPLIERFKPKRVP